MTRRLLAALGLALTLAGGAAWKYHADRTLPAVDPTADTLILGASVMYRWPERSPDTYAATFGTDVQNLGKRAWTTRLMRRNLPIHTGARRIVVDLGGSDLRHDGRPPLDTAVGVAAVVESLVATTEAHVWVLAVLPAPGLERQAEATNTWTRSLLTGYRPDRVTWVETYVPLAPGLQRGDGYHPSAAGYAVLAAQVADALADGPRVAVTP